MKPARKFRKKLRKIQFGYRQRRYRNLAADHRFERASADWLIHREIVYGGIQKNIRRRKVSPADPRSDASIQSGGMRGGDRMLFHGYAAVYSEFLKPLDRSRRLTIAEIGILRGNGLAIWCDLFPNGRVLGFDIDTGHFEDNRQNLLDRGAFSANAPEIHTYDQFVQGEEILSEILQGDRIDVCIDDGCHLDEAIVCTMNSVMPHLSDDFVYFVEDNSTVHKTIGSLYPDLNVISKGQMTIITRRP